jgi:hypothetical protein
LEVTRFAVIALAALIGLSALALGWWRETRRKRYRRIRLPPNDPDKEM